MQDARRATSTSCFEFEDMYRAYAPLARSVAFQILRNPSDAEDAVQTVFLRFWSDPGSFRGGNFESWITVLARHASLDMLRRRRRERAGAESLATTLAAADVETLALLRMRGEFLWRAVSVLPAAQRDAVLASYYAGVSHRHIAQRTSVPIGTVKSRIRSGIRSLRRVTVREEPRAKRGG